MSDHVWFGKEILPYINRLERRVETLEAALRKIAETSYMQDQALSDIVDSALTPEQDK